MTTEVDDQIRAMIRNLVASAPTAPQLPDPIAPAPPKSKRSVVVGVGAASVLALAIATGIFSTLSRSGHTGRTTVSVEAPAKKGAPNWQAAKALRLTVTEACPKNLGGYTTVKNSSSHLGSSLLPPGTPSHGLICSYAGDAGVGTLIRSRPLSALNASRLADAINSLLVTRLPAGVQGCPEDTGETDIIVVSYPHLSDVDLWYHASGCRTLSNGFTTTAELGNPTFETNFMPVIATETS